MPAASWNPNQIPKGKEPTSWDTCADPPGRQVLIDIRNRLQSLQHDPKRATSICAG
jgi:hypothetical protein